MLLAIVRHAKAEKGSPSGLDQDRALTQYGTRQAEYLARRFAEFSVRPDGIVASRALRTRQTAAILSRACGLDFDFDDRLLVGAPMSGAVELIVERAAGPDLKQRGSRESPSLVTPAAAESARPSREGASFFIVVGHNDQVSDLAMALTRGLGRGAAADSGQWDQFVQLATGQALLLDVARPESPIGGCRIVDSWRLGGTGE